MKTHILLVDDDIDEVKLFVEALKGVIGTFKCTYASNGIHALKMMLYLKPEAIFADYNMPAMNGIEFAKEVKKVQELRDIPLFIYSTYISTDIIQKAKDAGISGCLEKPSTMAQLSDSLKKVLAPLV